MIKIINNLWTMIKMMVIFLIMLITIKFVGTEKLVETGLILFGFYTGIKIVDLLTMYLKSKIKGVKDIVTKKNEKVKDEVNPEVKYIEGLIDEISKKAKKTIKDKNNLDLLKVKLKQLKNV